MGGLVRVASGCECVLTLTKCLALLLSETWDKHVLQLVTDHLYVSELKSIVILVWELAHEMECVYDCLRDRLI